MHHTATVEWERKGAVFIDNRYSRMHTWKFDGGTEVMGSSAPQIVPAPLSDPRGVDPEEAFIASLASCHMLWFLSIAARKGFVVENYTDVAEAESGKNEEGKIAILQLTLKPVIFFAGTKKPTEEEFRAMHHEAHEKCFIAASVKTHIKHDPRMVIQP
ncbi:MAG TPA: OsmC family protein [Phycisphaerae bacterium]|nr:OsmC family protein [Phycisphaerae bacterium]